MAVFRARENIFVLETENYQYVLGVGSDGLLRHLHWGEKVQPGDFEIKVFDDINSNHSYLDTMCQEYSPFGSKLFRDCAFKCRFGDGVRDAVLVFKDYVISDNTLKIFLDDIHYRLEAELLYTVYEDCDVMGRKVIIRNTGEECIECEKVMSAELSFPEKCEYEIINTNGTWWGEYQVVKERLSGGTLAFESRKGTSAHCNAPFFIAKPCLDEGGEKTLFGALEYSGSFKVSVSRDGFNVTRAMVGVNDFDFIVSLKSGEEFSAPWVYFGCTESVDEVSRIMNRFALKYVFPEQFREKPLPVLYNSWEATGFDVTAESQKKLAEKAAKTGAEVFVMDDGWFGERKDDFAGLGDWYVNKKKFPNGLSELIDYVNGLGMDFGIWIEPEMVNPDSDLYREHPDWIYNFKTRTPSEMRNQLVLNLTKPQVKEFVFNFIDKLLSENNIKYIKWDMNRPISEPGAENLRDGRELWFRHTMAVYEIVDKLKEKYPETQFEACASGGGRCDYGAFRHFDEIWTSDNTKPVDRIEIQNGYALINPTKAMRAWVTDSSDAPLSFKFNISMQGALGLGMNLLDSSEEELACMKKYVEIYKENREVIQFGDRYGLMNLKDHMLNVNEFVNVKKSKAIIFAACVNTKFLHRSFKIKLKGLEANSRYSVEIGEDRFEKSGSYLMNVGIERDFGGDYKNEIWTVNKIN